MARSPSGVVISYTARRRAAAPETSLRSRSRPESVIVTSIASVLGKNMVTCWKG